MSPLGRYFLNYLLLLFSSHLNLIELFPGERIWLQIGFKRSIEEMLRMRYADIEVVLAMDQQQRTSDVRYQGDGGELVN